MGSRGGEGDLGGGTRIRIQQRVDTGVLVKVIHSRLHYISLHGVGEVPFMHEVSVL